MMQFTGRFMVLLICWVWAYRSNASVVDCRRSSSASCDCCRPATMRWRFTGRAVIALLRLRPSSTLSGLSYRAPQDPHGAHRKLCVGFVDRSFPDFVFFLICSPAHPFRLCWRRVPAAPSFTAELAVQHCGPSLKATEAILSLTGVSEPIGLAAPEMPSAIRQIELRRFTASSRANEPPALAPIGRCSPRQLDAIGNRTVAFPVIAGLVGQFDEGV